jgi:hypothetical protein
VPTVRGRCLSPDEGFWGSADAVVNSMSVKDAPTLRLFDLISVADDVWVSKYSRKSWTDQSGAGGGYGAEVVVEWVL